MTHKMRGKAVGKGYKKADDDGDERPASGKGTSTSTGTSTKTSTVANPHTSTVADTQGNVTVTGGAGDGDTIVHIGGSDLKVPGKISKGGKAVGKGYKKKSAP